MSIERHDFRLEQKRADVSGAGTIEGYGSVFTVPDRGGDVIAPGAFDASLAEHKRKGTMPAMLYQHDNWQVCGAWRSITPDKTGLKMNGEMALATTVGKDAYELLKMGALDGLSIGFRTIRAEYNEDTDIRTILEAELWECSIVTWPMQPLARVAAVKSIARGETPTKRECEAALRDALGLSTRQAKALLAGGYGALTGERDAAEAETRQGSAITGRLEGLAALLKGA